MKIKYTYQRNIELINLLYESELGNRLCENSKEDYTVLKPVIESFYEDPDVKDRDLFINNKNRELGLDGLCGWKILFDLREGNRQWLKDYEAIRGSKLGYLVWPNKTNNRQNPTINQLRHAVFGDRIDYTLYDIDLFLKNEKCRLAKAYVGQTADFLRNFNDIKDFSKVMNLEVFLDEKGNVKNLDGKTEILTFDQYEDFSFSLRWGVTKKREALLSYIENLVKICEVNKLANYNLQHVK